MPNSNARLTRIERQAADALAPDAEPLEIVVRWHDGAEVGRFTIHNPDARLLAMRGRTVQLTWGDADPDGAADAD